MAIPGHQRNASQGRQLIMERGENGDEDGGGSPSSLASPCQPTTSMPVQSSSVTSSMGVAPSSSENRKVREKQKLRDNLNVVIGSIVLTILGVVLLIIGIVAIVMPQKTGLHGWVFLFAGFLVFIPGIYHVVYVLCTICGCPGYSFNNLPTFNKWALVITVLLRCPLCNLYFLFFCFCSCRYFWSGLTKSFVMISSIFPVTAYFMLFCMLLCTVFIFNVEFYNLVHWPLGCSISSDKWDCLSKLRCRVILICRRLF